MKTKEPNYCYKVHNGTQWHSVKIAENRYIEAEEYGDYTDADFVLLAVYYKEWPKVKFVEYVLHVKSGDWCRVESSGIAPNVNANSR